MIDILYISSIVYLFAYYDYYHLDIKKKYIKNHNSRWILRGLTILLLSNPAIICGYICFDILLLIAFALFFASTFDKVLNFLRSKPFWYIGNTADWDVFWNKRMKLYKTITILMFLTSVFLLIYNGF